MSESPLPASGMQTVLTDLSHGPLIRPDEIYKPLS